MEEHSVALRVTKVADYGDTERPAPSEEVWRGVNQVWQMLDGIVSPMLLPLIPSARGRSNRAQPKTGVLKNKWLCK